MGVFWAGLGCVILSLKCFSWHLCIGLLKNLMTVCKSLYFIRKGHRAMEGESLCQVYGCVCCSEIPADGHHYVYKSTIPSSQG